MPTWRAPNPNQIGAGLGGGIEVASDNLDVAIEQSHSGWAEFVKGNPEPAKKMFSHKEDVTLANPFGLPCVDGSRLPPLWNAPHRCIETARSLALMP